MNDLSLSRTHYPVRNLGFGCRAGIWFQGCSIRCAGCVSHDTWAFRPPRDCRVDDVLAWLHDLPDDEVDGVTITGGEPTDQPEALRELLDGISRWRAERAIAADVLLFSGRESNELTSRYGWLAETVDLLISGPYVARQAGSHALRGSGNQKLHHFTPLARHRYPPETFELDYARQRHHIGVHVDAEAIWMVGIPLPHDMSRLREVLSTRGIEVTRTSWLS